jgi:rSAM/selenodomain-associated transferase 1
MNSENLIIVFIKNPVLGKVKTRLAKSIGDEQALHVYTLLLDHTNKIVKRVNAEKAVFYSDFVDENDVWRRDCFIQLIQKGQDIGERMSNAFLKTFKMAYKNVVLIGSDCFELDASILNEAFHLLKENEVVLGPAKDGGYYLIGMRNYYKQLFENKQWSTENVLLDTLLDLSKLNISYKLLPTLSDIDEEKDLVNYKNILEL